MNFVYEIEAICEDEGAIARCAESDADYWGVYERPTEPDDHGARLAVWIADFARREDAEVFKGLLEENAK